MPKLTRETEKNTTPRGEKIKMISFKQKRDFSNTIKYLASMQNGVQLQNLDKYGQMGVEALRSATPKDSGLTADSWVYKIVRTKSSVTIKFYNTNIENGIPLAILLQYGHATKNGGWVEGKDYINPAIQPIFDQMAREAWKEVKG